MILYNVTVSVQESIHEDWLQWMQQTHIPDVMATRLFSEYRLCQVMPAAEGQPPTYQIQYYCASMEDYEAYQRNYAKRLQAEHVARYGGQCQASRALMKVVKTL